MAPLIEMRQISKTFGPVVALRGVDFAVRAGEVAGLVGDNGAGKSALMKVLTGVLQPDGGEIWFDGRRAHFASPLDSRRAGIEMVYQDLALAENLTPIANTPAILAMAQRLEAICRRHGVPLRAAAIQFPLAHPAVVVGVRSAAQMDDSVAMFRQQIPATLWEELKDEGLVPATAPVPAVR